MLPPSTDPTADDATDPHPADPSLPPPPPLPPPPGEVEPPQRNRRLSPRARRRLWIGLAVVAMLGSTTVAAAMVKVHYWSYSPGAMRDTDGVVVVDGVDVYPTGGEIAFATVSIRGRLSLLSYAVAWLDPDAVIVPEEQVVGSRDPAENRQVNLQLMDLSTQIASYVALQRLGHEVTLVGSGAMVVQVVEGRPADGVLDVGDTVVAVDGVAVDLAGDLVQAISRRAPGTTVTLTVEPLGAAGSVERQVTLGARDEDPAQAFLGVVPQTRDAGFEFPFDIDFRTGGVSGPSAGLAFSLALLDLLTPGDLTGGSSVAVTGTIDLEGNVGRIGGLEFKTTAARRAGFDVFLVPASSDEAELEEARRRAGDELRIIPVDTLDEALAALVELGGDPLPTG